MPSYLVMDRALVRGVRQFDPDERTGEVRTALTLIDVDSDSTFSLIAVGAYGNGRTPPGMTRVQAQVDADVKDYGVKLTATALAFDEPVEPE